MTCFKGDKVGRIEEVVFNFDMFVNEIIENIPVPGIIVIILAIIKYFQKEEVREWWKIDLCQVYLEWIYKL